MDGDCSVPSTKMQLTSSIRLLTVTSFLNHVIHHNLSLQLLLFGPLDLCAIDSFNFSRHYAFTWTELYCLLLELKGIYCRSNRELPAGSSGWNLTYIVVFTEIRIYFDDPASKVCT